MSVTVNELLRNPNFTSFQADVAKHLYFASHSICVQGSAQIYIWNILRITSPGFIYNPLPQTHRIDSIPGLRGMKPQWDAVLYMPTKRVLEKGGVREPDSETLLGTKQKQFPWLSANLRI
jgi:hypothetical protein